MKLEIRTKDNKELNETELSKLAILLNDNSFLFEEIEY